MDNYTGKRLDGRYEIQEVVGVGGMAVVYKAYDNIDDRIVAVKILKEEFLANEEFRRRFKNESKAISLLSHPNIVKVYNVNYGDRLQYIVMEYVEGITLKEYIEQQGRLGIKETIHFTMQILRALQHAHDKGIIHRDIKPQNILLLSNGNIKVTDFGIARFSYSDTKTMTDSAIGSVHYISPEQARGNSIDERTDIYSVGVVMYEMLTGRLPFISDNSVSVALMQLQNDPKSIREINPNIPVGLEQIVKRAMEKNTKSRYQTASEMLLDIEEFKRNPNIHFQPGYYVDSDPTKFAIKTQPAPVVPSLPAEPAVQEDEEEEDERRGGRAGFIITGILIGLIAVGLIVFAGLFFLTDTFQKATSTVPNFVGLNYETDVLGNEDYGAYRFVIKNQEDDKYNNGQIVDQDPPADRKLDPSNPQITLTVIENVVTVAVPDVSGMTVEKAEKILTSKGFNVTKVPTINAVLSFGTVIKTEPVADTQISKGDTVTIIYASDEDLIEVPKVVGWDTENARNLLESVNLALDENIETVSSNRPKGEIISQNPAEGDKALPGARIKVTVSSGVAQANLKVKLPSRNEKLNFEIYVNNESVFQQSLLMDGSVYTRSVEGDGANATIKVYIDNREYFTCSADFTVNPARITDEKYSPLGVTSISAPLPSVTGMTMSEAQTTLNEAGFYNITINPQQTENASEDGIVISQSPEASASETQSPFGGIIPTVNSISTDTEVILTVGQYEGVASENPPVPGSNM